MSKKNRFAEALAVRKGFGTPPDGVQVTPSEYRFSKEDLEEYVASGRNRRNRLSGKRRRENEIKHDAPFT